MGTSSPPFKPSWAEPPSLPPGVRAPPHAKDEPEAGLGKIVLQPLIRGRRPHQHLEEDVATILGFSAPLYEVRQLSWRPAQVDLRASLERFSVKTRQASTTRQVNGRPVRGMSLYKGSQCTFLPLSNNISRRLHLLTHREEKLSVKTPTRPGREQTVEKTCRPKIVRKTPFLISIWFMFFVLCSLLLYAQALTF